MILIFLCKTLQFYIKHLNEDRFIKGSYSNSDVNSVAKSDVSSNKDFFAVVSMGEGMLVIKTSNGKAVWDIGNAWTLTYNNNVHKKDNQHFYFSLIEPKTFIIKNRGKCIEYDKNDDKYYSKNCTLQDNQKFQVLEDKNEAVDFLYSKAKGKLNYKQKSNKKIKTMKIIILHRL
ncbi:ricin B lectin (PTP6c) [Vairimorpha necatrix]|uniref:Ricin B lectin (PTP6c) n=1 Tax=Vairimorpha necatrix TaxID=6039 RepID=A0AAX4J7U9_9MICR